MAHVPIARRRKDDISNTYDGVTVVSDRFKRVCEEARMVDVVFKAFLDDPGFHQLWTDRVVAFDPQAAGTRFGPVCPACGKHIEINTTLVRLKPASNVPPNGFARTDLWFAGISGYDERCPVLLCGIDAARVLRTAHLKGLEFDDE